MNRAGIETWLMHVLRHIDRSRFQMDFLVHTDETCQYDDEIRSLGGNLLRAAHLRNIWKYERTINEALRIARPYDIVHSHLDYFSGFVLKCARKAGVPIRIAHSHNDLVRSFARLKWHLKLYARRSQSLIFQHATHGLAASTTAGESLFGSHRSRTAWRTLHYGIDLSPFSPTIKRAELHKEFGIPPDAMVIGHVGRFYPQKNHEMLLRIAEALRKRSVPFQLVLVGDGPLRSQIEREVETRGLRNYVTFTGVRADVPELFTSLFDVFLFPSLYEGLGLVIVEALAANCRAIISDVVPEEADVVPNLVRRLSLAASADQWADAVLESARAPRTHEQWIEAFETVRDSRFNISKCVADLTHLYFHELSKQKAG